MEAAEENPGVDGEEERLDLDDEMEQSEGVEGEQVLLRGEDGVGVEVREGQREEDEPGGGGVTRKGGGLDVEGGGGRETRGQRFSEAPEGDPLCLSEDGGGGRGGALAFSSDGVSGWSRRDSSASRSRESSCTTTSSTWAFVSSEARGASSPTEL